VGLLTLLPINAFAQSSTPRPRPAAGSVVTAPRELFSEHGELNVTFNYYTTVDSAGRSQAMLNPGSAGMPVQAADVDWTFPPTCTTSAQRWRATSR
jgi:hypothetical protein